MNFFPTVLEAGSLRSGGQQGWLLLRALFWATDSSWPPHRAHVARELFGVFSTRAPPS